MDVESYKVCEEGLILEIEAHAESAAYPRCDTVSYHLHQKVVIQKSVGQVEISFQDQGREVNPVL